MAHEVVLTRSRWRREKMINSAAPRPTHSASWPFSPPCSSVSVDLSPAFSSVFGRYFIFSSVDLAEVHKHEWRTIGEQSKARNERIWPLGRRRLDCVRLRAVKCHHSLLLLRASARELRDCLAFYFLSPSPSPPLQPPHSSFCHSISSTFDLFYFHFKGSDGTDVVSNVCLLPHCLKVRADYFLMKAGKRVPARAHACTLTITCKAAKKPHKQYSHIAPK